MPRTSRSSSAPNGPPPQLDAPPRAESRRRAPVAGHRTRLEQRLELPGLGPALPVGPVGARRADEGPVTALGAQVDVDPKAPPRHVHHLPRRARAGVAVAVDEQHVDVAGVVELLAPELPHGDHGEALARRHPARSTAARSTSSARSASPATDRLRGRRARSGRARRCAAARGASRRPGRPGCERRRGGRRPRSASTSMHRGSLWTRRVSDRLAASTATRASASPSSCSSRAASLGVGVDQPRQGRLAR